MATSTGEGWTGPHGSPSPASVQKLHVLFLCYPRQMPCQPPLEALQGRGVSGQLTLLAHHSGSQAEVESPWALLQFRPAGSKCCGWVPPPGLPVVAHAHGLERLRDLGTVGLPSLPAPSLIWAPLLSKCPRLCSILLLWGESSLALQMGRKLYWCKSTVTWQNVSPDTSLPC